MKHLLAASLLLTSPALAAQATIFPLSEDRSVWVRVTEGPVANPIQEITDERTADGFGDFTDTVQFTLVDGADFATAFATIDSSIEPTRIRMAGRTSVERSATGTLCSGAVAGGTIEFFLTEAVEYRMSGVLEGLGFAGATATLQSAAPPFFLDGDAILFGGSIPLTRSGVLGPGTHTLRIVGDHSICAARETALFEIEFEVFPLPGPHCPATPNSTGDPALLTVRGAPSLSENDLTLFARFGRRDSASLLLMSAGQTALPIGDGTLCLASPFTRLGSVVQSTPQGTAFFPLDLASAPFAAVQPGDTLFFQWIFRDTTPAGLNLSNLVPVTLTP
ncbi:MAG: hypothetical protein AAFU73_03675 [Planctomycetota bacterium]